MNFIDYHYLMHHGMLLQKYTKENSLALTSLFENFYGSNKYVFAPENWNNLILCAHLDKEVDLTINSKHYKLIGVMQDKHHRHILYYKLKEVGSAAFCYVMHDTKEMRHAI